MKTISIIISVLIIAALAWLVFTKKLAVPGLGSGGASGAPTEQAASLGGELFNAVKQNPADSIPDTNPFKTDPNPYKSGYTNPF